MTPITGVLPRPVPVSLAGRVHRVRQLRLADVAELQQWLAEAVPSPYPEHRGRIDAATGHERLLAAAVAYLECENFPAPVTGRLAPVLFGSAKGKTFLLDLLGLEVAPGSVTDAEFYRLWEVLWGGGDALAELSAILDGPGPSKPSEPINWARTFCRVSEATGWTFDQIGQMYVSQWIAYCSGGEDRGGEMVVHPGEDPEVKRRDRLELFAEAERVLEARKENDGH